MAAAAPGTVDSSHADSTSPSVPPTPDAAPTGEEIRPVPSDPAPQPTKQGADPAPPTAPPASTAAASAATTRAPFMLLPVPEFSESEHVAHANTIETARTLFECAQKHDPEALRLAAAAYRAELSTHPDFAQLTPEGQFELDLGPEGLRKRRIFLDAARLMRRARGMPKPLDELLLWTDKHSNVEEVHDVLEKLRTAVTANSAWAAFPEFQWRYASALLRVGYESPKGAAAHRVHLLEARSWIARALEYLPDSFETRYLAAIIYGLAGDYLDIKGRIGNAYLIQAHALRAKELNPEHSGPPHVLGQWCFQIAGIPAIARPIAALLFARPPESTFAEALENFLLAARLDGPHSPTRLLNAQYVGDTYRKLGDKANARVWFERLAAEQGSTESAKLVVRHAKKALEEMKAEEASWFGGW